MILTPVLVMTILLAIQGAIYFHAANVALAGAARGAAAASPRSASPQVAAVATAQAVAEMGGELATAPAIEVTADEVRVTARVKAPRLVPFFPSTVSRHASEPRERHISEPRR